MTDKPKLFYQLNDLFPDEDGRELRSWIEHDTSDYAQRVRAALRGKTTVADIARIARELQALAPEPIGWKIKTRDDHD